MSADWQPPPIANAAVLGSRARPVSASTPDEPWDLLIANGMNLQHCRAPTPLSLSSAGFSMGTPGDYHFADTPSPFPIGICIYIETTRRRLLERGCQQFNSVRIG